jgi:steroid delta-isomerase-like uncharacterized protein
MTSRSTQLEQNKQVVRQFFDAYNEHDVERMAQLVSRNSNYFFHLTGMPLSTDWNGRTQYIAAAIKAFPEINHHILDTVAEGDKVAVRLNITGTHKGDFQGIPPTGKEVSFDGMDFLTVIDGKIAEEWLNSDIMGLMQQIGAMRGPPS